MMPNDWRDWLPHRGAMSLLDELVAWDETRLTARAISHRDRHNPLRDDDGLRALAACEYAAQAMALHGGLLAHRAGGVPPTGLLAALREVRLFMAWLDDLPGPLEIAVCREFSEAKGWLYTFVVSHAGAPVASGRAAIGLLG
jgi:predicted hotdog family 3-hydroxylacyl-ACP dehydratase